MLKLGGILRLVNDEHSLKTSSILTTLKVENLLIFKFSNKEHFLNILSIFETIFVLK